MKAILPGATLIGFTGTPLLKSDKRRSIETFGPYIHTYKYDEAIRDEVVLGLRYEARDIDQNITSEAKVDQWFDVKTRGLGRAQLASINTRPLRAIYDNLPAEPLAARVAEPGATPWPENRLDPGEVAALAVDRAVRQTLQDGWRGHPIKERRIRRAVRDALGPHGEEHARAIFAIVKAQHEY